MNVNKRNKAITKFLQKASMRRAKNQATWREIGYLNDTRRLQRFDTRQLIKMSES